MNVYELNKMKRSAVAMAWMSEKMNICKGIGQRDWFPIQQDDILKYTRASGFVAQFITVGDAEEQFQVQFVEASLEYLVAHDPSKNNTPYGFIDLKDFKIKKEKKPIQTALSDPFCKGYDKSHRELFAGQDTGLGFASSGGLGKCAEINKDKFGLNQTGVLNTGYEESKSNQERLKKYGF